MADAQIVLLGPRPGEAAALRLRGLAVLPVVLAGAAAATATADGTAVVVDLGEATSLLEPPAAVVAWDAVQEAVGDPHDAILVCRDAAWAGVARLGSATRGWPVVAAVAPVAGPGERLVQTGLMAVARAALGDASQLEPWAGRVPALVCGDPGDPDALAAAVGTIRSMELEEVRERFVPVALGGASCVALTGDAGGLFATDPPAWAVAAAGAAVDAVLALQPEPAALAQARAVAERAGLPTLAVRLVAGDVPDGDGDLVARATGALRSDGLVALGVQRLMWPLPRAERPPAGTGRRERIDADTRELFVVCAPAEAPATLDAVAAELTRLRHRVDVLGELQIERSLSHLDEVKRAQQLQLQRRHIDALEDAVARLEGRDE